jgi:predicted O-methyltransferase YrrM
MRLLDYYDLSAGLKRLRRASVSDLIRWGTTLPAVISAPHPTDIPAAVCQIFPGTTRTEALALQAELSSDEPFLSALDVAMQQRRRRRLVWQGWHPFLYTAVRRFRPAVMFETGVFDGLSSALILRAMERNAVGELVSIDLPAREIVADATDRMWEGALPLGCGPGWLIPDRLRARHRLYLGDSKNLLPAMLDQYRNVDIFLHDSLHTYRHQLFEYTAAWAYLRPGGLLLSDEIFWSAAFYRFCKKESVRYVTAGVGGFGIVRKPGRGVDCLDWKRDGPEVHPVPPREHPAA